MPLDDDLAEYRRLMQDGRDGRYWSIKNQWDELEQAVRRQYRQLSPEETEWIRDRLLVAEDLEDFTWGFVVWVLRFARGLSESLFQPLLLAAVYEADPSANWDFVEPAVREFGYQRVEQQLAQYLNDGTNVEKCGAVNAFYQAGVARIRHEQEVGDSTFNLSEKLLTEFVKNDDIQVRRCIIPHLITEEHAYSPEIRHLVAVAIDIARNHPDDYIRHRIEVQLGNESLLQPLPPREDDA